MKLRELIAEARKKAQPATPDTPTVITPPVTPPKQAQEAPVTVKRSGRATFRKRVEDLARERNAKKASVPEPETPPLPSTPEFKGEKTTQIKDPDNPKEYKEVTTKEWEAYANANPTKSSVGLWVQNYPDFPLSKDLITLYPELAPKKIEEPKEVASPETSHVATETPSKIKNPVIDQERQKTVARNKRSEERAAAVNAALQSGAEAAASKKKTQDDTLNAQPGKAFTGTWITFDNNDEQLTPDAVEYLRANPNTVDSINWIKNNVHIPKVQKIALANPTYHAEAVKKIKDDAAAAKEQQDKAARENAAKQAAKNGEEEITYPYTDSEGVVHMRGEELSPEDFIKRNAEKKQKNQKEIDDTKAAAVLSTLEKEKQRNDDATQAQTQTQATTRKVVVKIKRRSTEPTAAEKDFFNKNPNDPKTVTFITSNPLTRFAKEFVISYYRNPDAKQAILTAAQKKANVAARNVADVERAISSGTKTQDDLTKAQEELTKAQATVAEAQAALTAAQNTNKASENTVADPYKIVREKQQKFAKNASWGERRGTSIFSLRNKTHFDSIKAEPISAPEQHPLARKEGSILNPAFFTKVEPPVRKTASIVRETSMARDIPTLLSFLEAPKTSAEDARKIEALIEKNDRTYLENPAVHGSSDLKHTGVVTAQGAVDSSKPVNPMLSSPILFSQFSRHKDITSNSQYNSKNHSNDKSFPYSFKESFDSLRRLVLSQAEWDMTPKHESDKQDSYLDTEGKLVQNSKSQMRMHGERSASGVFAGERRTVSIFDKDGNPIYKVSPNVFDTISVGNLVRFYEDLVLRCKQKAGVMTKGTIGLDSGQGETAVPEDLINKITAFNQTHPKDLQNKYKDIDISEFEKVLPVLVAKYGKENRMVDQLIKKIEFWKNGSNISIDDEAFSFSNTPKEKVYTKYKDISEIENALPAFVAKYGDKRSQTITKIKDNINAWYEKLIINITRFISVPAKTINNQYPSIERFETALPGLIKREGKDSKMIVDLQARIELWKKNK